MRRAYFMIIIILFVLSSLVLIPDSHTMVLKGSESDVKVGAYYYVWYDQGAGKRHWNSTTPEGDTKKWTVVDHPDQNYYSSQNESLIRKHLDWMKELGIDFLIVSWWGPNSYEDNSTKILFNITRQYADWMKLAVQVEGFSEDKGYNFTEIYEYLNTNYVVPYNEIYMRLNDRPLVCWFNFPNMTVFGDNRLAIYNDSRFEARIVGQSYYVDWWFGTPWSMSDDSRPIVYRDKEICVEPRYDDSYSWGNHSFDYNYSLGLYDAEWRAALGQAKEGNVNIVTIYSWNEYHERSQIEPCNDSTSYKGKDTKFYIFDKTKTYISQIKSLGGIYPSFTTLGGSSYIVDRVGGFWVAQNGTSGTTDFNNTDASTTIQSCINNLTTNIDGSYGGTIFLKSGSIFLTSPLVIPRPNIILEGEGRATGLVGNFSGDIITIESANETPGYQYTMFVKILNILFYNAPNSNFTQTAIHLNISKLKLWYIDLEDLNIFGMNGIRTDQGDFWTDKTVNVMENLVIRNVIIQNAPSFGIELWSSIDVTMDTVHVTFEQNGENAPVDNTTGIQFSLNGVSSGTTITNTRVLRAEYGITIIGVRDLWMTNVLSDICKTWAFKLDGTTDCILTNVYATSPNGTGIWITGNGSQNRIIGATIKDSTVGVKDDSIDPQYFDNTVSETQGGTDWTVKSSDMFSNCNHENPDFTRILVYVLAITTVILAVALVYVVTRKQNKTPS